MQPSAASSAPWLPAGLSQAPIRNARVIPPPESARLSPNYEQSRRLFGSPITGFLQKQERLAGDESYPYMRRVPLSQNVGYGDPYSSRRYLGVGVSEYANASTTIQGTGSTPFPPLQEFPVPLSSQRAGGNPLIIPGFQQSQCATQYESPGSHPADREAATTRATTTVGQSYSLPTSLPASATIPIAPTVSCPSRLATSAVDAQSPVRRNEEASASFEYRRLSPVVESPPWGGGFSREIPETSTIASVADGNGHALPVRAGGTIPITPGGYLVTASKAVPSVSPSTISARRCAEPSGPAIRQSPQRIVRRAAIQEQYAQELQLAPQIRLGIPINSPSTPLSPSGSRSHLGSSASTREAAKQAGRYQTEVPSHISAALRVSLESGRRITGPNAPAIPHISCIEGFHPEQHVGDPEPRFCSPGTLTQVRIVDLPVPAAQYRFGRRDQPPTEILLGCHATSGTGGNDSYTGSPSLQGVAPPSSATYVRGENISLRGIETASSTADRQQLIGRDCDGSHQPSCSVSQRARMNGSVSSGHSGTSSATKLPPRTVSRQVLAREIMRFRGTELEPVATRLLSTQAVTEERLDDKATTTSTVTQILRAQDILRPGSSSVPSPIEYSNVAIVPEGVAQLEPSSAVPTGQRLAATVANIYDEAKAVALRGSITGTQASFSRPQFGTAPHVDTTVMVPLTVQDSTTYGNYHQDALRTDPWSPVPRPFDQLPNNIDIPDQAPTTVMPMSAVRVVPELHGLNTLSSVVSGVGATTSPARVRSRSALGQPPGFTASPPTSQRIRLPSALRAKTSPSRIPPPLGISQLAKPRLADIKQIEPSAPKMTVSNSDSLPSAAYQRKQVVAAAQQTMVPATVREQESAAKALSTQSTASIDGENMHEVKQKVEALQQAVRHLLESQKRFADSLGGLAATPVVAVPARRKRKIVADPRKMSSKAESGTRTTTVTPVEGGSTPRQAMSTERVDIRPSEKVSGTWRTAGSRGETFLAGFASASTRAPATASYEAAQPQSTTIGARQKAGRRSETLSQKKDGRKNLRLESADFQPSEEAQTLRGQSLSSVSDHFAVRRRQEKRSADRVTRRHTSKRPNSSSFRSKAELDEVDEASANGCSSASSAPSDSSSGSVSVQIEVRRRPKAAGSRSRPSSTTAATDATAAASPRPAIRAQLSNVSSGHPRTAQTHECHRIAHQDPLEGLTIKLPSRAATRMLNSILLSANHQGGDVGIASRRPSRGPAAGWGPSIRKGHRRSHSSAAAMKDAGSSPQGLHDETLGVRGSSLLDSVSMVSSSARPDMFTYGVAFPPNPWAAWAAMTAQYAATASAAQGWHQPVTNSHPGGGGSPARYPFEALGTFPNVVIPSPTVVGIPPPFNPMVGPFGNAMAGATGIPTMQQAMQPGIEPFEVLASGGPRSGGWSWVPPTTLAGEGQLPLSFPIPPSTSPTEAEAGPQIVQSTVANLHNGDGIGVNTGAGDSSKVSAVAVAAVEPTTFERSDSVNDPRSLQPSVVWGANQAVRAASTRQAAATTAGRSIPGRTVPTVASDSVCPAQPMLVSTSARQGTSIRQLAQGVSDVAPNEPSTRQGFDEIESSPTHHDRSRLSYREGQPGRRLAPTADPAIEANSHGMPSRSPLGPKRFHTTSAPGSSCSRLAKGNPVRETVLVLRIDSFSARSPKDSSGGGQSSTKSVGSSRNVNVVRIFKDPDLYALPELVTQIECAILFKDLEGHWAQVDPSPGRALQNGADALGHIFPRGPINSCGGTIEVTSNLCGLSTSFSRLERRLAAAAQCTLGQLDALYGLKFQPGSFLGQRFYSPRYCKTIYVFLNNLSGGGGEIAFINLGIQIKPKRGTALLWSNRASGDGADDGDETGSQIMTHCDNPADDDFKYILVCHFSNEIAPAAPTR